MRPGLIIALASGALLVPASPAAAADTFEGGCSFSGRFKLHPPIGNVPADTRFGDRAAGTCTGSLNGRLEQDAPIVIRAGGSGRLGCLAGRGMNFGRLTFTRGTESRRDDVSIGFSTEAAGVLTQFAARVRGAISGEGVARVDFLPYADQEALDACAMGTFGTARYDAVVRTITPIVG